MLRSYGHSHSQFNALCSPGRTTPLSALHFWASGQGISEAEKQRIGWRQTPPTTSPSTLVLLLSSLLLPGKTLNLKFLSRHSSKQNHRLSRTSLSSCCNSTRRSTHGSFATRSSSIGTVGAITRSGRLSAPRQHVCRSTQQRSGPTCSQCASRHPIHPVTCHTQWLASQCDAVVTISDSQFSHNWNLSCPNGPDMHELYDIYYVICNIHNIINVLYV